MTTEALTLKESAKERVVELVPGFITLTQQPMGVSEAYVCIKSVRVRDVFPGDRTGRRAMWLDQTVVSEYINETWTNLALYALCFDWYTQFLFIRRGGLRATLRAVRELKAVRDACRVRRHLLNECESGASHGWF